MDLSAYKIGVDGGGTKTELILVDARGSIAARHTAPGCNPSQIGADAAREVVKRALAELRSEGAAALARPGATVVSTHLFMAGAPAFWTELAATLAGCGRVETADDSLPVIELATGGAPGLVLHAGTGSFIAALAADRSVHYAGGLGWKIGDPGSGFEIGRRGAARALLELQGWAELTPLGPALQAHTGMSDAHAITRFWYSAPDANARLAAFAPRVVEAAGAGCVPARALLAATLADLVDQARLVTTRLFAGVNTVPCGVSGAILNSLPARAVLEELATAHGWPVRFRFITEPPIEGVRRLLARD